jgi:colanic acid/amylovoran biosynthesis glycosyltransferase
MTMVAGLRSAMPMLSDPELDVSAKHRVAYVVSHYPLISHVFIQREVRALRARGVEVEVFSIHRSAAQEVLSTADAEEAATTHTVLPLDVRRFARAHRRAFRRAPGAYLATLRYALKRSPSGARAKLWQLFYFAESIPVWDACEQRGIRHLHAHFANVAADVAWLAAEFGRRADPVQQWHWSLTMHGCVEFWDVDRFNLARKVAAASLVLCISEFTRAQLMALSEPRYWPKLEVVHCGVDLEQYSPAPGRARHDAPLEVLCVGRLSPEKGQFVLLDAVARLRREGIDVHVTIVGDGPLRDALFAHAIEVGVDDRVTFAGSVGQDHMPAYFRAADVFCQPSFNEGIPVVLMEAMASGLPVVSSAVGAIDELVDDGGSGFLVTPARPSALAAALRRLTASEELRAAMGARGREIVEREFDAAASAREVERRFEELVDGSRCVPTEVDPGPDTRLW